MNALAVFLGFLLLALAVWDIGRRWLQQQADPDEPELDEPELDEPELDETDEAVLQFIRDSRSGAHEAAMLQAWREEKRAEGMDEQEIERVLAAREPILRL